MSETRCGHLALEAMATICKAMSHLEVADVAVVAFGEPGNVRLVHGFDQHFGSEEGANVIFNASFKKMICV